MCAVASKTTAMFWGQSFQTFTEEEAACTAKVWIQEWGVHMDSTDW